MARPIVDLSVALENDVPADPPGYELAIQYAGHKDTVKLWQGRYENLDSARRQGACRGASKAGRAPTRRLRRWAGPRGGELVVTDLLSGQISATMATVTNFREHTRRPASCASWRQRPRSALLCFRTSGPPDLAETLPGYAVDVFVALSTPTATPSEILEKVSADVAAIVREPDYREKNLCSQFLEPVGSSRA